MRKIKDYDVSVDIIRILAAFLVILGHTTDRFVLYTYLKNSVAGNTIYYLNTLSHVAVPLFVLLSGYLLLRKEKIKNVMSFYKRRFSRILLPFIFWVTIYAGVDINWDKSRLTMQYVQQRLWNGDLWHLYFLVIILELYLITPILMRITEKMGRNNRTVFFWLMLGFSICCSLLMIYDIDFKKNILTMFIPYISIFYAGAYLRTVNIRRKLIPILLIIYFILPTITNKIGNGILGTFIVLNYSPTILPMTLCLFLALKNIQQFFGKLLISGYPSRIISFTASTTFGIFLIHILILDKVFSYFHLYPWEIHKPLVFYACLPAILTFIISFIIIALFRRIPYLKYLTG
jgi:surface polysaccharide O-acyltransferase-like enzyme